MKRKTGTYLVNESSGESIRCFIPHALPPSRPALKIEGELSELLGQAESALGRLRVAGKMVPDAEWFIYGFVRKEAVISSQIEGTQATLEDVLSFEVTQQSEKPEDAEEVCNYIDALNYARKQLASKKGLPISTRLLCGAHKRLMKGVRGAEKSPGNIRKSPNWIGGTRPGNAVYVPPPANEVAGCLAALEKWIHSEESLPPLIRIGLAHVQFESIHPFLDGNGRIGRLLVTLLIEHWKLLDAPLLYVSLALKQRQQEYYRLLSSVRSEGDWEGWLSFFLEAVRESAENGVQTAEALFSCVHDDRKRLLESSDATIYTVRLLDLLPGKPIVTAAIAAEELEATKPSISKAIDVLEKAKILRETTGKRRDRVYAYQKYLDILTNGEVRKR
ncbi:MAG: Fic family protein [Aureliella sp.]